MYKDPLDERLRAARRKHYHKNKEQYLENNRKKKARMTEYIGQLKSVPCKDCGVSYPPYVMDFDHRETNKKFKNVSKLVSFGNWEKIKAEIEKCDVVCSNCHRIRTWGEGGTNRPQSIA